jgi:hypothetical protein
MEDFYIFYLRDCQGRTKGLVRHGECIRSTPYFEGEQWNNLMNNDHESVMIDIFATCPTALNSKKKTPARKTLGTSY